MTPALQNVLPKTDRPAAHSQPGKSDRSGSDFDRLLGDDVAENRTATPTENTGNTPVDAGDDARQDPETRDETDDRLGKAHACEEAASALQMLASLLASRGDSRTDHHHGKQASADSDGLLPSGADAADAPMPSEAPVARAEADRDRIARFTVLASRQYAAPASTSFAAASAAGTTPAANALPDAVAQPASDTAEGSAADPAAAPIDLAGETTGKQTASAIPAPGRGASALADRQATPERKQPVPEPDTTTAHGTSDRNVTLLNPSPVGSTGAALATAIGGDLTAHSTAAPGLFLHRPGGSAAQSAHVLKIELHPAELGSVTASLRFAGEQLSIEIQVENHEAFRQLNSDREELTRTLHRLGFDVDRITILQPQTAATPAARVDAQAQATALPSRDGATAFGGSGQGGGSDGTGNQRSGRNQSHDAFLPRDPAPGRHDDPRGGLVI